MAKNTDDKKNPTELGTSSNLVALGTVIGGNIGSQGNIRVEGTVDGSLDSQQKIIIGESAKVNGDVRAVDVEISGEIKGDIYCADSLYLKKSALIYGDIYTKKLIIENGAEFNGKCNMGNNNQLKVERKDGETKKQASSN